MRSNQFFNPFCLAALTAVIFFTLLKLPQAVSAELLTPEHHLQRFAHPNDVPEVVQLMEFFFEVLPVSV